MTEHQLTREQLHEAIWTTPTTHLAKSYGLTPYRLMKICEQFDIPRPGNDHWPSVRLGYQIEKTPLPPPAEGTPAIIRIAPATPSARPVTQPASGQPSAAPVMRAIPVADDFRKAHPLVRSAREILAKATPNTYGLLRAGWRETCIHVAATKAHVRRALLLMDAILRELERLGHRAQLEDRSQHTLVTIGRENVRISLLEKTERRTVPEKERKYSWDKYVYSATGLLTFRIDEYAGDARKVWRDGQRQKLEEVLGEIVASIVATGEAMRLRSLELEEERRLEQIRERRQWELQRQREREAAHVRALEQQAQHWRTGNLLRDFVRACQHTLADRADMSAESPALRWLGWASIQADRIDPLRNGWIESAVASLPPDVMRVVYQKAPSVTPPPIPRLACNNFTPASRRCRDATRPPARLGGHLRPL